MYSRKEWNAPGFCAEEVVAQRDLAVTELGCLAVDGLKGVRVRASGRGLKVSFRRVLKLPVRAEILRVAGTAAPLSRAVRIARLTATKSFSYAPRRALAAGTYVLRLRVRSASGLDDVRDLGFSVAGGHPATLPAHVARDRCTGALRSAALGAPVFGPRLAVRFRLNTPGTVTVELRRGGRLVRRVVRRTQPVGSTRAVAIDARGTVAGAYSVRVRSGGRTITLRATRL
jgi:hypothetical protein